MKEESHEKVVGRFWFKVHDDINGDLRFALMSNEHLGIYHRLVAMANTDYNTGVITASRRDIAALIRMDLIDLNFALAEFEEKSLIYIEGNTITIAEHDRHYLGAGLNWSDTPAGRNERQRARRQRLAEEASAQEQPCHSDMSPRISDQSRSDQSTSDQSIGDIEQISPEAENSRAKVTDLEAWLDDLHYESDR